MIGGGFIIEIWGKMRGGEEGKKRTEKKGTMGKRKGREERYRKPTMTVGGGGRDLYIVTSHLH